MPTLECLDMAGHQVPGLVDVAEELVVVGLWEREEPCLSSAFRTPPQTSAPRPQARGASGATQQTVRCMLTVEDAVDEGQVGRLGDGWGRPPDTPEAVQPPCGRHHVHLSLRLLFHICALCPGQTP